MEFQLIDKELSEARLFRTSRSFGALNGRDVANMLYLNTIILYLLSRTKEEDYAKHYAQSTVKFGTYALFRTHAADLYMLAYQTLHPDNDYVKLDDAYDSKKFLKSLPFNGKQHLNFIRKIAGGRKVDTEATAYLYRLEFQLKIKDSRYKIWRRTVGSWDNTSEDRQQAILKQISREIRRLGGGAGRGTELLDGMRRLQKVEKEKVPSYMIPKDKPSGLSRAVDTAIGGVVGGYAGKKLSGMEPKKAARTGAGIGAIAGFWAGGKRKQK